MKLDRLVLVNWGQLRPGDYDIGNMTLLTGPTGSGKSTMLDGLQTVLTAYYQGIVAYNPGQDEVQQGHRRGKTKRTLESFVVGAEYSKFSRPEGAHGYIAAVFRPCEDEAGGEAFTALVGVAARVDGAGDRRSAKLEKLELVIVDGAALTLDDFYKLEGDQGVAVPVEEIVRKLKAKYPKVTTYDSRKKDYLSGLYGRFRGRNSIPWEEAQNAAKAWSQSIAYKPIGSVHELVRDEILEFDNKALTESITRISDLMRQVTTLKQEGQRLEESVTQLEALNRDIQETATAYEEHVLQSLLLSKMSVRDHEHRGTLQEEKIRDARAIADKAELEVKTAKMLLEGVARSQAAVLARLEGNPLHGQKERLEETLARATAGAKETLSLLARALFSTGQLDNAARSLMGKAIPAQFSTLKVAVEAVAEAVRGADFAKLAQLTDEVADLLQQPELNVQRLLLLPSAFDGVGAGVEQVFRLLTDSGESVMTALATEAAGLDRSLRTAKAEVKDLAADKERRATEGGNAPSDVAKELQRLREALPEANAQILCDLVEPVSDEWQDAVESYMANARFNVIVNPAAEVAAIRFVSQARMKLKVVQGAQCLANADEQRVPAASIVHELRTEHPIARAYLVDMFGPVVKVASDEDLRRTPRGVMKDGKASGGRTMFGSRSAPLVFGRAARERALAQVKERLASAEAEVAQLEGLGANLGSFKKLLSNLRAPEFNPQSLSQHAADIDHSRRTLSQLDLSEIADLRNERDQLQRQASEHEEACRLAYQSRDAALYDIKLAQSEIASLNKKFDSKLVARDGQIQRLKKLCEDNPGKTYTALSELVDTRLAQQPVTAEALDAVAAVVHRLNPFAPLANARESLIHYNSRARPEERFSAALPVIQQNSDFDPCYAPLVTLGLAVTKLHAELDGLGLYKNRNEVDKAERSFHDVFTKQFCVEIKTKVDDGIRSLRQLNHELSKLKFGSDKFSIDWSKWEPEYEEYYAFFTAVAELADSPETVDLFGTTELTAKEIAVRDKLVKLLLDPEQASATQSLLRIADYRNYRRYEIWNESDSGGRIALSTWGTGSGGQLETPAYIVRAAVFTNRLKLFEKGRSLKLLVSDESFSKMDEPRARAVLRFLRDSLGLQVISAMPTRSAGGLRPEFTREYSYSRAPVPVNGELDFVLDCDERELKTDGMRDLWAQQRQAAREQAKLLFDESEPLEEGASEAPAILTEANLVEAGL